MRPELKARREELGFTWEQIEAATRIPARYLQALEEGTRDVIPTGPFERAYLAAYRAYLGFEDPVTPSRVAAAPAPPDARRTAAIALGVLVAASFTAFAVARLPIAGAPGPVEAPTGDVAVQVTLLRSSHLKVRVDGKVRQDQEIAGGTTLDLVGDEEIAIDVPSVDRVSIRWNGARLQPQGPQGTPRRLVFVDDSNVRSGGTPP